MPIRSLNVAATEDYISPFDDMKDDPTQATIFKLKGLDSYQNTEVQNSMTTLDYSNIDPDNIAGSLTQKIDPFIGALNIVRMGLKGWIRFKDAEGNDIPFKTKKSVIAGRMYEVVHDDCLSIIPLEIIQDLSAKIRTVGEMKKEELKNLDGESSH